jgi:protein-S-isoprenylcysteine O-methyltransferase Ste14
VLGVAGIACLVFVPAWTLDYWQGWVFLAVFAGMSAVLTVALARRDPALLERRMRAGPRAETEPAQKIVMWLAMIGFGSLIGVSALDHRFRWSKPVPAHWSLAGDALVVTGFLCVHFMMRANTYAASTVRVEKGQQVISTGPYRIVRHPMYAGVLPMLAGIPIALGSWWGLAGLAVIVPVLAWRLLDEERVLVRDLPGYPDYMRRVRYRLVPFVW